MRALILVILLLSATPAFAAAKRVLMMIPNDFMWPEYALPFKAYKEAGFDVVTAARFKEAVQPDRRNTDSTTKLYAKDAKPIQPDLTFDDVKVEAFDAVTFVAGNGAWHDFFPSDTVHKIVLAANEKQKVLGLLCASTGLLGLTANYSGDNKAIAEGKKVVGYYRVEGLIRKLGRANYIPGGNNEPGVEADGNLVTGRNPESSQLFADKVVSVLKSR